MSIKSSIFTGQVVIALTAIQSIALADIPTDGTLGAQTNFSGPNFVIPDSTSSATGGNLFHSFSQFDLNAAQSVAFIGDGGH